MARKHGLNLETLSIETDLSNLTNDADRLLIRLDKDYVEVVEFTVLHTLPGVGAQNIDYTLKTAPSGSGTSDVTVSKTTGTVANAGAAGVSSSALGNGPQTAGLVEGRNLILTVNFAAAVTSGPRVAIVVRLRK
jgi:hypothetical protein